MPDGLVYMDQSCGTRDIIKRACRPHRHRVPYPMGFYTKWLDGRIDDAKAGWKGRGLWASISTRAPFHMEGGKGTTSKAIRFQLRPDPLAK